MCDTLREHSGDMPDDAVRAVAELAASQHRAFTRHQAAALNFDYRQISTGQAVGMARRTDTRRADAWPGQRRRGNNG